MNINWQAFWDPKGISREPGIIFTCLAIVAGLCLFAIGVYAFVFSENRPLKIYRISAAITFDVISGDETRLGVHYPANTLVATWALGFAREVFCWIIFRYFNHKFIKEGTEL